MRLALMRGVAHDEFLRTTSAREVAEYQALHLIDPLFDGQRVENSLATLTNLQFNLQRHPDTEPTTVADWLPNYAAWLQGKAPQTDEQISAEFDAWYAAQVRKGLIKGTTE